MATSAPNSRIIRPSMGAIAPAAVLLLAAILPLPAGGKISILPSLCAFHNLTGLPCPGCGLTRSFVCLAHGHFAEAVWYHPMGPVLFLGTILWMVLSFVPRSSGFFWRNSTRISSVIAGLLLVIWAVRLGKLLPGPDGTPGGKATATKRAAL